MDALDFLGRPGFQRGLLLGMGSAALAALACIAVRARTRPGAFAGLAFVVAGTAGAFLIEHPTRWLAIGMAALVGGALVALAVPVIVRPVFAVPGALLLAGPAVPAAEPWARALMVAAIVVGGALAANLDLRWRAHGVAVAMFGVTVLGIYATVPDTEEALVLLGVMVPVALLGFPLGVARLGAVGAVAAIALAMWNVAYGGRARETAIVGGVACLGMFVIEPVIAAVRRGARRIDGRGPAARLLAGHVAVVFVASRIVGVREQLAVAAAGAAVLGAVALLAMLALSVRSVASSEAGS